MITNNLYDTTEKLGNSTINHGKYNDRIYLMKLADSNISTIIEQLESLAKEMKCSKIFAKIPSYAKEEFINRGFEVEASVPGFYCGKENALFLGKYFNKKRKINTVSEITYTVINTTMEKKTIKSKPKLDKKFTYKVCQKEDTEEMAKVYRRIFETYPFPIYEPEYIKKTMDNNIVYFSILKNGKIVSLSSSEMDEESQNVEMTDFATLPEYRGNGFAVYLLDKMEDAMKRRGIKTAYTIARAVSFGMNITFSKKGYEFGGTLINNTNISGSLESMNVWYKVL